MEGELKFSWSNRVQVVSTGIAQTVKDPLGSQEVGTDPSVLEIVEMQHLSVSAHERSVRPLARNAGEEIRVRNNAPCSIRRGGQGQGCEHVVAVERIVVGVVKDVEGVKTQFDPDI